MSDDMQKQLDELAERLPPEHGRRGRSAALGAGIGAVLGSLLGGAVGAAAGAALGGAVGVTIGETTKGEGHGQ